MFLCFSSCLTTFEEVEGLRKSICIVVRESDSGPRQERGPGRDVSVSVFESEGRSPPEG